MTTFTRLPVRARHDNDNDLCHVAAFGPCLLPGVRQPGRPQAPAEAALRACCPSSAVVRCRPEASPRWDLEAFWRPREALLTSGRLVAFHEWPLEELAGQVWVDATWRPARALCQAGWLDGAPWEGAGFKHFQMVRMTDGWRIASLAWQDDA